MTDQHSSRLASTCLRSANTLQGSTKTPQDLCKSLLGFRQVLKPVNTFQGSPKTPSDVFKSPPDKYKKEFIRKGARKIHWGHVFSPCDLYEGEKVQLI